MRTGDRVLTYVVERELGEGGVGTVYLGRHTALDQLVAIKTLSPMLSRDQALRARFLQEANIQAKLRHPGIVQVLNADMESDQPSLVMEYVEGKSLSEVLELRGALPIDDALKIMEQVLSAVGYVHRQGVIHRELKPSNFLVIASGETKIKNFGIEKVLGSYKLTRKGTAMGTAHYMSPEQIRRPESVDARSDIYSLGCVFYEVLTGRPPFGEKDELGTESDYEVKTAHVTEAVPALETGKNGIPEWLAKFVMSMLEKEPEKRPANCELIIESLKIKSELEKPPLVEEIEVSDYRKIDREKKQIPSEVQSAKTKTDDVLYKVDLVIAVLIIIFVSVFFVQNEKTSESEKVTSSVDVPQNQQETNSVEPMPLHEQRAVDISRAVWHLGLAIKAGNPNNLESCPLERNARRHNCWGTLTDDGGHEYIGEFKDNKKHGQGAINFAKGDKYIGEFKYGKRHGLGTYTHANGAQYIGEYRYGKKYGFGFYTFSDGTEYVGEWKDDERIGQGTFAFADGKKYVGEWQEIVDMLSLIKQYESCRHFLGEPPFDEDRERFLFWATCEYCKGFDNDLFRLKTKYHNNQNFLSFLADHFESLPLESGWDRECSEAKKPKG
jgi:serine/threonine protein kinase